MEAFAFGFAGGVAALMLTGLAVLAFGIRTLRSMDHAARCQPDVYDWMRR